MAVFTDMMNALHLSLPWLEAAKGKMADVCSADITPFLCLFRKHGHGNEKYISLGFTERNCDFIHQMASFATTYALRILKESVLSFKDFIVKLADSEEGPRSKL